MRIKITNSILRIISIKMHMPKLLYTLPLFFQCLTMPWLGQLNDKMYGVPSNLYENVSTGRDLFIERPCYNRNTTGNFYPRINFTRALNSPFGSDACSHDPSGYFTVSGYLAGTSATALWMLSTGALYPFVHAGYATTDSRCFASLVATLWVTLRWLIGILTSVAYGQLHAKFSSLSQQFNWCSYIIACVLLYRLAHTRTEKVRIILVPFAYSCFRIVAIALFFRAAVARRGPVRLGFWFEVAGFGFEVASVASLHWVRPQGGG